MDGVLNTTHYEQFGFKKGMAIEILAKRHFKGLLLADFEMGAVYNCEIFDVSADYDKKKHENGHYAWIAPDDFLPLEALNNRSISKLCLMAEEE